MRISFLIRKQHLELVPPPQWSHHSNGSVIPSSHAPVGRHHGMKNDAIVSRAAGVRWPGTAGAASPLPSMAPRASEAPSLVAPRGEARTADAEVRRPPPTAHIWEDRHGHRL